jgi:predicted PurR-regulated permease PerM
MKDPTLQKKNEVHPKETTRSVFTIVFLAICLIIGCLVVWYATNVFLIGFAAILLSILLQSIGEGLQKVTRLPYFFSLSLGILIILTTLFLIFWFFSPLIGQQIQELSVQLPKAYNSVKDQLQKFLGISFFKPQDFLLKNEKIVEQLTAVFSFTVESIISFVIFIFVGIYLAYAPQHYFHGFIQIFPPRNRKFTKGLLEQAGKALRWWVLGKIIAMISIGILIFTGLWILNVPLAFILGLLAALLTFIPYIGPILAAIPAILIGLSQNPLKAIYVALLYCLVQMLEGYLITPYIDQKTVSLPPALTIMVQVLMGILVGFWGIALASPLTVLALVILKRIYAKKEA